MTRSRSLVRRATVAVITALLLVSFAATVSAHESREVEGEFRFVVGFMNEPAFLNQMNGLDLRISYLDSEEPVENAEQTLNAEIQYGGESMELDVRALWGQPGAYTADVLPTETGTYTFLITGEIDGVEINESFQGGPDTFSEVESTDALEFPGGASASAESADDDSSNQAMAIGIAGVVAGLLGLLAGGVAYFKVSNPGKNPAQQRREQRQASQQSQE